MRKVMKEKYFNDLGLDNGEELLNKFNLSDLVEMDKKQSKEKEEREKSRQIKEIKKNI
jgi:hypothetical protein